MTCSAVARAGGVAVFLVACICLSFTYLLAGVGEQCSLKVVPACMIVCVDNFQERDCKRGGSVQAYEFESVSQGASLTHCLFMPTGGGDKTPLGTDWATHLKQKLACVWHFDGCYSLARSAVGAISALDLGIVVSHQPTPWTYVDVELIRADHEPLHQHHRGPVPNKAISLHLSQAEPTVSRPSLRGLAREHHSRASRASMHLHGANTVKRKSTVHPNRHTEVSRSNDGTRA